ncbi:MAG: lactate racemase domain-containing protein [Nitrospirae bacterium]|nr:lactate racemase domain-containing protein [Nitrospirota bacterium]
MIETLMLAKARQIFPRPCIEDMPFEISMQMKRLSGHIRPGMSVAITAGSRGISKIAPILQTIVKTLRNMGAEPFIVSAMGSHGSGTVKGQENILHNLGITQDVVGAPLKITSDAVEIGTTPSGHILYIDSEAMKADGILLVNRIKPHTALGDNMASGLFKMLTIGLGKVPGAIQAHRLGASGIYQAILEMAQLALKKLPVIGGLAIVENGYMETAKVELLLPEEMDERERKLLKLASSLLPGLPVQELDLLIVEEMGKNYSGTGMDTHVIGRWKIPGFQEPESPKIGRIVVLRLSDASEGNANGIGLADFTTYKLIQSIDWNATLINVSTTGFWRRVFCPPFLGSDREAITWALESLQLPPQTTISAARIRNTLQLEELWLSPAALNAAMRCEQIGPFQPLEFNQDGELKPAE